MPYITSCACVRTKTCLIYFAVNLTNNQFLDQPLYCKSVQTKDWNSTGRQAAWPHKGLTDLLWQCLCPWRQWLGGKLRHWWWNISTLKARWSCFRHSWCWGTNKGHCNGGCQVKRWHGWTLWQLLRKRWSWQTITLKPSTILALYLELCIKCPHTMPTIDIKPTHYYEVHLYMSRSSSG